MGKKKILFVDDEENLLTIMKLNLERTGEYEVRILPGADNIIAHVKEFQPDIILLDIRMPGISGDQACRMLRKDPQTKEIPIISLSALDTDKDNLMMREAGAIEHLVKPVEKNELICMIEKVLGAK